MDHLNNPRFRFREDELLRIHSALGEGLSVLLTGIRRTGKSEVQKAALYRYHLQGKRVDYLDIQDISCLARFYELLLQRLLNTLPKTVIGQLQGVFTQVGRLPNELAKWVRGQIHSVQVADAVEVTLTPPDEKLRRYWSPLVDEIGGVLATHPAETLPVIGLDELPFMLENLLQSGVEAAELQVMLASLRKLRGAGLRLIIAGSISFENLLSLHNIPHTVLGGLSRQNIPPFTREEAHAFLAERLHGRPAGEALEAVLDALPDYVPEFLVIAATQLQPCRDAATCESALTQHVLPAIRRSFLQQFDERLNDNYAPDEQQTAQLILDQIASVDAGGSRLDGTTLPVGYRQVLLKLEYDNFLVEGEEFKWRFSLNLIRLWWRANRGMA